MTIRLRLVALLPLALLLAACGPTRHVFPPDVGIQQVRVGADGRWTLDVRINNYSYDAPVRFQRLHAAVALGDQAAGTLDAPIGIDIAARSADVVEMALVPAPAARKALDALGNDGSRSVAYTLSGTVTVSDENGKGERSFPVDHHDFLSPVPGVSGTYR